MLRFKVVFAILVGGERDWLGMNVAKRTLILNVKV